MDTDLTLLILVTGTSKLVVGRRDFKITPFRIKIGRAHV